MHKIKKHFRQSRIFSIVSIATLGMIMLLSLSATMNVISFFPAKAENDKVVTSSDAETVNEDEAAKAELCAEATPVTYEADETAVQHYFRVTRQIDGVDSPMVTNSTTENMRDYIHLYGDYSSNDIYFNCTDVSYDSKKDGLTLTKGLYCFNCYQNYNSHWSLLYSDRYLVDRENIRISYCYVDDEGNDHESNINYTFTSSNGYIEFYVPSNIPEDAVIVFNVPYVSLEEAHKISIKRNLNTSNIYLYASKSSDNTIQKLYGSALASRGNKSECYEKAAKDSKTAYYCAGVAYAQEGGVFYVDTDTDTSSGNFQINDLKVYTTDENGEYTILLNQNVMYDDNSGNYFITMPKTDILIDVNTQNTMNKVKVVANSSDYKLTSTSIYVGTTTDISYYRNYYPVYSSDLYSYYDYYTQNNINGVAISDVYVDKFNNTKARIGIRFNAPVGDSTTDYYEIT